MKIKTGATGALLACLLLTAGGPARGQQADQVMRANYDAAMLAAELAGETVADYQEPVVYSSDEGSSQLPEVEQVGYLATHGPVGLDCNMRGPKGRSFQVFAGAEYIYARASFSEALAYVSIDPGVSSTYVEYDFDYNSSYSFYGGVRFCDCLSAIVFDYDRYTSDAAFQAFDDPTNTVGPNIVAPFELTAPNGGSIVGNADVELNSYDLAFQKTIPLGGCKCCDGCCDSCCDDTCCDDPCCGSACCVDCPLWDITWSAAFRAADVGHARVSTVVDPTITSNPNNFGTQVSSRMDFEGFGGRIGIGGRRYFGKRGWFSLFANGNLSVLVGDMDYVITTTDFSIDPNGIVTAQIFNTGRRVIPVTEIEAGATVQITNHIVLSSGYFLGAWHDLGFRDQGTIPLNGGTDLQSFDDANILGWDGFFARVEVGF